MVPFRNVNDSDCSFDWATIFVFFALISNNTLIEENMAAIQRVNHRHPMGNSHRCIYKHCMPLSDLCNALGWSRHSLSELSSKFSTKMKQKRIKSITDRVDMVRLYLTRVMGHLRGTRIVY